MEIVAVDSAKTGADAPAVEWRGQAHGPRILLHFDIWAVDEAIRRRADRFRYGYRETRRVSTGRKTYRYPGFSSGRVVGTTGSPS